MIIGITGGSGSGKTTLLNEVLKQFEPGKIAALHADCYYKDNSPLSPTERKLLNFDHPDSIDFDLFYKDLLHLSKGNSINAPTYDFISSTRLKETLSIHPTAIIIVEGILLFADKRMRNLCNLKVFIDANADERLSRIIKRDMEERGRALNEVLERNAEVETMYEQFVEPARSFADIIVAGGGKNQEQVEALMLIIKTALQKHTGHD